MGIDLSGLKAVTYKGLVFRLPAGDEVFHKKIGNYVDEVPKGVRLLPRAPRGMMVVIGACFGSTVLAGLKMVPGLRSAVAFEPDPDNLPILEINLATNGANRQVIVVPKACGAEPGKALMSARMERNIGAARVFQTTEGEQGLPDREVEVVTADSVVGESADKVGLVWCDAQGSEPFVFKGAKSLLTGRIPWGVELSPGLIRGMEDAYCGPLEEAFDTVVDLRKRDEIRPISELRAIYKHYLETPSPSKPSKPWHTQLLVFRADG